MGFVRTTATVLGLAASVVMTGCSSGQTSAGRLVLPGDGSAGYGLGTHEVAAGTPLTNDTMANICTTGRPVTISRIRLAHAQNIVLMDWAWRRSIAPGPVVPVERRGIATLASKAPGDTRAPINYRCTDTGLAPEIAITVRTTAQNGKFVGYWIDYDGGSLYVPYELDVCAQKTCPPGFERSQN